MHTYQVSTPSNNIATGSKLHYCTAIFRHGVLNFRIWDYAGKITSLIAEFLP